MSIESLFFIVSQFFEFTISAHLLTSCSYSCNIIVYFCHMKIEEAKVYCLATSNRGMRSEQIADMINRQRLHLRKDGQPVSAKQVFYVVAHAPHTFCLAEGRIMLMM